MMKRRISKLEEAKQASNINADLLEINVEVADIDLKIKTPHREVVPDPDEEEK